MNCTDYTYYVMLMARSMCTLLHHPLKSLPSTMCHAPIQVSQNCFVLRLICMILGCDLLTQLLLESLSIISYEDRLVDRFHHVLMIHVEQKNGKRVRHYI